MDKEDKSESHTEGVIKERETGTEEGADLLYEQEETSGDDEGQTEERVHQEGEEGGVETKKPREKWRKIVEIENIGGYGEETRQPYPYSPEYYHLKVRTQGAAADDDDDDSECVKSLTCFCNRDNQVRMENQEKRQVNG